MRKVLTALFVLAIIVGCKPEIKKEETKTKDHFPSELGKVFEKHGGLKKWQSNKTLSFNKGKETHTIDLQTRKTIVNAPDYSLGFDGNDVWISKKDSSVFKSDPKFYYNLYFYFYGMPFVLADNGILYEKIDDLTFEGKTYPGFKISYQSDIGTSPDDNYFIYYNSETYQMEWLGYTVTYFSKKPTDKFNIIRYNDWTEVQGLLLPASITWYKKDEDGIPTEPKDSPVEFTLHLLSRESLGMSFYKKK